MNHNHQQPAETPTATSTSLLDRIRFKDREAWGRFVAVYGPFVYDVCRRYGVQPADADDVAQEVLQSVSNAISTFKKDRPTDSFRGWLYRIVQNKVRDHFRRSAKQATGVGGSDFKLSLDQLPEEISDSAVALNSLNDTTIVRALDLIRSEFQERTWTAFWRLAVEGHSAAEIAADLDMKTNAVRQAKFRIVQRLRAEFGDLIELPHEET